jgi:hypothetical protein
MFSIPYHIAQIYKNYYIFVEHLTLPTIVGGFRVARSFVFCVLFCRSLFVLLSFFFWPFCCLSFDLRLLITSFVPSSLSCRFVLRGFYTVISMGCFSSQDLYYSSAKRNLMSCVSYTNVLSEGPIKASIAYILF